MNEERFASAEAVLRGARMPASGEDLILRKRSSLTRSPAAKIDPIASGGPVSLSQQAMSRSRTPWLRSSVRTPSLNRAPSLASIYTPSRRLRPSGSARRASVYLGAGSYSATLAGGLWRKFSTSWGTCPGEAVRRAHSQLSFVLASSFRVADGISFRVEDGICSHI